MKVKGQWSLKDEDKVSIFWKSFFVADGGGNKLERGTVPHSVGRLPRQVCWSKACFRCDQICQSCELEFGYTYALLKFDLDI